MAKKYVVTKGFSVAATDEEGSIRRYDKGVILELVSINILEIVLKDIEGCALVINTLVSHSYVEKLGDDK